MPSIAREGLDDSTSPSASAAAVKKGTVRLHVKPLDAELLSAILPVSIRSKAENISYHSLEAFPESRYGFFELPVAEAERLRRRLHGSVLKGVKIRIETARLSTMAPPDGAAVTNDTGDRRNDVNARKEKSVNKKDRKRKRKRDGAELPGALLEEGRKVQRGWTAVENPSQSGERRREKKRQRSKDRDNGYVVGEKADRKKKRAKSQFRDEPECLFKTTLPNGAAVDAGKRRKQHSTRETVIHEFEKTTKLPTFLKTTDTASTDNKPLEYVDGRGWVNGVGKVVEEARTTRLRHSRRKEVNEVTVDPNATGPDEPPQADKTAVEQHTTAEEPAAMSKVPFFAVPAKPTKTTSAAEPVSILKSSPARPKSSGSARSLRIKIPPPPSAPAMTSTAALTAAEKNDVHPLEAIYKRSRFGKNGVDAEATEEFSFFATEYVSTSGDDEDAQPKHLGAQVPMTPFTRADFEWRGQRSAAPTPDTAFASRSFRFWAGGDGDGADSDFEKAAEEGNENAQIQQDASERKVLQSTAVPPSTMDKEQWFWGQRGDLNRAWRARRRTAAKESRYRGNKARAERV
jgi:hypothetical protein